MADFPITEAQLTGLFLESIIFGIYLVTFGMCLHTLLMTGSRWRGPAELNVPMIIVTGVFFVIAAFDLALGFYHNIKAFVLFTGDGGAATEFTNISDWVNVMKSVTVVVQTTIGDAMLIYRCWVVWGGSWVAVGLSLVLWFGELACTIGVVYLEATLHSRVLVNASELSPFGTGYWAITIVLNIITTGLLVWRIWIVDRDNHRLGFRSSNSQRGGLRHVIRSIIESGLLYTISAVLAFITYVTNSNAVYPVTDAEIQIVGIAFNLIIIRAAKHSDRAEQSTNEAQSVPLHFMSTSRVTSSTVDPKSQVHVVVTQETDGEIKTDLHSLTDGNSHKGEIVANGMAI